MGSLIKFYGGYYRDIDDYKAVLVDPNTSDEKFDMVMGFLREIVLNKKAPHPVRELAAKVMHISSKNAKAAACLYKPVPLNKRKRHF